jgi:AraC-like DNA-binding protein
VPRPDGAPVPRKASGAQLQPRCWTFRFTPQAYPISACVSSSSSRRRRRKREKSFFMYAAITRMHDAPGYKWTLQGLADRVGMSRTIFAQKFKKRVGMTPMEYLTRRRMLLAGDRLKTSDDSVAAISSLFGYETESAFGRAFRRFRGHSPRKHRRPDAARHSHRLAPRRCIEGGHRPRAFDARRGCGRMDCRRSGGEAFWQRSRHHFQPCLDRIRVVDRHHSMAIAA